MSRHRSPSAHASNGRRASQPAPTGYASTRIHVLVLLTVPVLLSTLAMQVRSASAHAFFDLANPVDSFLQTFRQWDSPTDATVDLRVGNVSVHRVRYMHHHQTDEDATDAAAARWDARAASSVVVTWEDHDVAVDAREERLHQHQHQHHGDAAGERTRDSNTVPSRKTDRQFVYEVQIWVNGWGFDAIWHASNRKVSTTDPFVVLGDLSPEHDLCFRVRLRVKQQRGFLSGFFATETDGPWSETVTLSPSNDQVLAAVFAFLLSNKAFFAVLAACIGLGMIVVLRLLVLYVWEALGASRCSTSACTANTSSTSASLTPRTPLKARRSSSGSSDTVLELEQEIEDLRQELADSETEVRRLMLLRGYGIDELSIDQLDSLENELRATMKRIRQQKLRRASTCDDVLDADLDSRASSETEPDFSDHELEAMGSDDEEGAHDSNHNSSGTLETVHEEDEEEDELLPPPRSGPFRLARVLF
ncbi:TPA: hypothetical protein N0F65_004678 [Lagenidium giganteum]|uniref:K-box domain-containing protein n=1 Tax=Lagenidium giganteum TaxID=4803 RepID=A0AAV2Z1C9_9STRA|nr:TPA: hypothetical protein N0F65_004678 [Lagenidium giganteum]